MKGLHCPATSWQAPSRTAGAVLPRSGSRADEASQGSAGALMCPAPLSPPKQQAGSPKAFAEGAAIPLKRLARLLVEMPCLAAQLANEMMAVQAMHARAASLDAAEARPAKRARRMDSVSSTLELHCSAPAAATAPASPVGPFKPTPLRTNAALLPAGPIALPTPRKAAVMPARSYAGDWQRIAAVAEGPNGTRSGSAFCPVHPQPFARAGPSGGQPAQLSHAGLALLEAYAAACSRKQASTSQVL